MTQKETDKKTFTGAYEPKVKVGKKVPDFKLPATGEKTLSLQDFRGKKLIIYFYPKDSTPGCTVEGQDFTRLHGEFKKNNAEVVGVSRDSIKSHENFKAKQNYSFELLSDSEEELCQIFGTIKLKNMFGKKVRSVDRSTFVVGEDGQLLNEWRQVKVDGHADEVLEYVKAPSS